MNLRSRKTLTVLAAALTLPIAGCDRAPAPDDRPPLAGAKLGGPFTLTGTDGRPVTDRSFAGRYRAVYFGYTFCPDVCPTTLQTLMAGYRRFAADHPDKAKRLVPLFISVDPERDTPTVMKSYVAAFGAPLVGLTGTPAQIAEVAPRYGVYARRQAQAKGASGYLVDHSSQVLLFGPQGEPLAIVPTDQGAAGVADSLAHWVRA